MKAGGMLNNVIEEETATESRCEMSAAEIKIIGTQYVRENLRTGERIKVNDSKSVIIRGIINGKLMEISIDGCLVITLREVEL